MQKNSRDKGTRDKGGEGVDTPMLTSHSTFTEEAIACTRRDPVAFKKWYEYVITIAELTPPEAPSKEPSSTKFWRTAGEFLNAILNQR